MKNFFSLDRSQWVFFFTLIFIVINSLLCANGWYYFSLLPVFALIIYLGIIALDKLFYLLIFLIPVSVPLDSYFPELGFNVQLPTDPIIVFIFLIFLYRIWADKHFDRKILTHPISLAIYANLAWMLITACTSSIPLVSFKYLLTRLWFLAVFYFFASQVFAKKDRMRNYFWAYIPLMIVVISIAIFHLSKYGLFNQQKAHLAASPFFNDHTSYGATLAMLFPFSITLAFTRKYDVRRRIGCWLLVFILTCALILSYSRAAWVSVLVAGLVYLLIYFKIHFRTLLIFLTGVGSIFFMYQTEIFLKMEQNRQDSSKDFSKHIQSISNIRTDVSNVERLNRWKSAFRMFKEKPILGWGPGCYMFKYAPFQLSHDKTIISTNRGNMGNAHSEYIGPLAESGVLGALTFILILILSLYTGIKVYLRNSDKPSIRYLVLGATLGLVTYYTHGILNNFLDTDKASALFWGYTAMIVAMDTYLPANDNSQG